MGKKKGPRNKKALWETSPRIFKGLISDEPCPCGGDLHFLKSGDRCLKLAKCTACGNERLIADCGHGPH